MAKRSRLGNGSDNAYCRSGDIFIKNLLTTLFEILGIFS